MTRLSRAIREMEYARQSHLLWARKLNRKDRPPRPQTKYLGSATFHRRWVKTYDEVIMLLRRRARKP